MYYKKYIDLIKQRHLRDTALAHNLMRTFALAPELLGFGTQHSPFR